MSRGDLAEGAANAGVAHVFFNDRTDVVRLMDAEDAAQHFGLAALRWQDLFAIAAVLAARHGD